MTKNQETGEAAALFLSYDGLTDPLGRSQVLPYLLGLVDHGHSLHAVSCDKPDRYAKEGAQLSQELKSKRLQWRALSYHKSPPILSTLGDIAALFLTGAQLHRRQRFDLVHCRSYPAGLAGWALKRIFGISLVFDMRGFWADEKVDALAWNRKNPVYDAVYRFFKKMEKVMLRDSDAVISLTEAAKEEMLAWGVPGLSADKVIVIPCCADIEHFDKAGVDQTDAKTLRLQLSLEADDFVLTYVGSLGSWYLLDEMLKFFQVLKKHQPRARFLFITQEPAETVFNQLASHQVSPGDVRVFAASRENLPIALSLADLGIYFRKSVYSALACSPTKLAEMLAMGLPVVTSPGIGDSEILAERYNIGPVAHRFDSQEYDRIACHLSSYLGKSPASYREIAQQLFTLTEGVRRYDQVYRAVRARRREGLA